MKKLIHLLLAVLFVISCNSKKSSDSTINKSNKEASFSSPTEINLTIKNYDSNKHKNYIDILVVTAIEPIKEQLRISDEGIVNYVFLNQKKKEIIFDYDGRSFSLIASADEKVFVELNIEDLLNSSNFKKFKVKGKNKTTNDLILANNFFIDSLVKQSTNPFVKDTTINNIQYKNKRILEMTNQLQIFNNFLSNKKIKDKCFANWGRSQIRYKAGYDLSLYPFIGKSSNDLHDESEYFSFVKKVGLNTDNETTYKVYLDYLESLTGIYNLIGNWSNKYKNKNKELIKNWPTAYFLKLELIKKLPQGKDREIIMGNLFKNEIRLSKHTGKQIPKEYTDSLKLYTNPKYVSHLFSKKEIEKKPIKTLIKEYDLSTKEKNELLEIYKNTNGKVIYHDFWFTNCAPCMKELPNYNDLIAKTNKKDVEFLFYGVHMKNEEWKKTIGTLKLKGKHYLLSKNQLAFFEKYFELNGFPHHQIIKSNGIIGEKVTIGTYPKNFNEIIKIIENNKVE